MDIDKIDGSHIEANNKLKQIIKRLRCSEKYKAIYKEIEEIFEHNHMTYIDRDLWNELKQKYFPGDFAELFEIVDRVKEVINKTSFTCEEIAERLIPKD